MPPGKKSVAGRLPPGVKEPRHRRALAALNCASSRTLERRPVGVCDATVLYLAILRPRRPSSRLSLPRQPQDAVRPLRRWSPRTTFRLPHSHSHSQRGFRRASLPERSRTVNRPNRDPTRSRPRLRLPSWTFAPLTITTLIDQTSLRSWITCHSSAHRLLPRHDDRRLLQRSSVDPFNTFCIVPASSRAVTRTSFCGDRSSRCQVPTLPAHC